MREGNRKRAMDNFYLISTEQAGLESARSGETGPITPRRERMESSRHALLLRGGPKCEDLPIRGAGETIMAVDKQNGAGLI